VDVSLDFKSLGSESSNRLVESRTQDDKTVLGKDEGAV